MDEPQHGHGPLTREKLIEAAGEIFAEKGLRGASIRSITERAGANIAAVNYHFHDKFELYTQVLQQAHAGVAAALSRPLTAATAEGRLRQYLSALLTTALDPARPVWHRRLIGRELLEPTPAADVIRDLMHQPAQRLVEVVRDIRPDIAEPRRILSVSAIIAQCLFRFHHAHIVRRMFPEVPEPSLDTVVDHVVEFSLAALHGLPADAAPPRQNRRAGRRAAPCPSAPQARRRGAPKKRR